MQYLTQTTTVRSKIVKCLVLSVPQIGRGPSAVAQRPRDALCPSVVSFNSAICRAESVIIVTQASELSLRAVKCCSAVFGVTLRLLSYTSSSPAINKRRRLPATSVINLLWSAAAECITLGSQTVHSTRRSQILAKNCDFCLPHLHSTPLLGDLSEYCHNVWYGRTRIVWLRDEKN